jgi:DeoR/GlpR family transcriptional regulator of sugar metabolism
VVNHGGAPPLPSGADARRSRREQRQRQIIERVVELGSSTASDLAEEFAVSLMTVHRDLDEIERRGIVRKFRGGVTALPSAVFESQLAFRINSNIAEKEAIAKVALSYVEPGTSVMLDDSTTALHMIPGLVERTPLHVATTFLEALRRLSEFTAAHDITLIGLGGHYDVAHDAFVGVQCVEQIQGIHADALFMSSSAVDGLHVYHQEERIVALKRAMMESSARRYFLIDHAKLSRHALHRILPLTAFDLVITDDGVDPETLQIWERAGVRYRLAPVADHSRIGSP